MDRALFEAASEAATRAYAPYSKFRVGAALLCGDGSVVTGANVENRSFGLTICAERSALVAAIALGKTTFKAISIATPDGSYPVSPCGACRQVLSEFLPAETPVEFGSKADEVVCSTIGELLPHDALRDLAR